jgi:drug/metabolite transporter (DMT)-like permease
MHIALLQRPFLRFTRRQTLGERAIGGVALAVSTAAGSTFNAFAKSLSAALSSLSLLFVSELLTLVFILFSFGLLPVLKSIGHLKRNQLLWLGVVAVLSGVLGPILLFSGITMTSAINAGFFGKMQIIFVLILARIVLKEQMTIAHLWAIVCIFFGITIIMLQGLTKGLVLQTGDLLILSSTLCYAAGAISFRAKLRKLEAYIATFFRSGIAVTFFFLASPFIAHPFIMELHEMPVTLFPSLIGFAFFARFLNSVTHYAALDRLHVGTVSLVGSLDIIGATFFSFLYLGEAIAWYHYMGGAFIILGNALLNLMGTHETEKELEEQLKQKI